jgi:hypothetical protein
VSTVLLLERLELTFKTGLLCDSYILFLIKYFYLSISYKISPTEAGGNQSLSDYRNQQPVTIRENCTLFYDWAYGFLFLLFFNVFPELSRFMGAFDVGA